MRMLIFYLIFTSFYDKLTMKIGIIEHRMLKNFLRCVSLIHGNCIHPEEIAGPSATMNEDTPQTKTFQMSAMGKNALRKNRGCRMVATATAVKIMNRGANEI